MAHNNIYFIIVKHIFKPYVGTYKYTMGILLLNEKEIPIVQ